MSGHVVDSLSRLKGSSIVLSRARQLRGQPLWAALSTSPELGVRLVREFRWCRRSPFCVRLVVVGLFPGTRIPSSWDLRQSTTVRPGQARQVRSPPRPLRDAAPSERIQRRVARRWADDGHDTDTGGILRTELQARA